jgi:hypothetical protein
MSNFKTTTRALASSAVLITATIGLLASAASAGQRDPFHGNLSGVTNVRPCNPGPLCLTARDTGEATHFGSTVMTQDVVVTPTGQACAGGGLATYTESATLTAANGDKLYLTGTGVACHGASGTTASGRLSPAGGTGRFSDATGTITQDVRAVPSGPNTENETVVLGGTLS